MTVMFTRMNITLDEEFGEDDFKAFYGNKKWWISEKDREIFRVNKILWRQMSDRSPVMMAADSCKFLPLMNDHIKNPKYLKLLSITLANDLWFVSSETGKELDTTAENTRAFRSFDDVVRLLYRG